VGSRADRLRGDLRRTQQALSHFTPFLRARRRGLSAALLLLILETFANLAQPWPLKIVLDYVIGGEELPVVEPDAGLLLVVVAGLAVAIAVATRGLAAMRRFLLNKLGQETVFDLRNALYRKVHELGLDYHGRRRTGDTITRLTDDVREVRTLLVDSIVEIGSAALILTGMLVVMFILNWHLTLVALITVPFLALAVHRYRRALIERMRVVRRREGAIASVVQEAVTGIRAVKLFGREEDELGRFREESSGSLKAGVESSLIEAKFSWMVGVVAGIGTAAVLYVGTRQVLAGNMTAGDLIVFITYLGSVYTPLWTMSRQVNQIGKALVSGERIVEVLETGAAVKDAPDAVPMPRTEGRVTFEDVWFAYDDEEEAGPVLRGVSFDVPPGSRVALVGVSGSGKTTITSLIARLYDPQRGRVLIDGGDVRRYTLESVRGAVTFVPQEPMLFRGTVAENIAYGRPEATQEEIRRAAELAGAAGFIEELPEGYETLLAERGESLSGGQRQRISLARAMLRDTPILVLDEPAAGLDAEVASVVEESWRDLTRGRTTFLISHELRLVRGVDLILVIEGGRIVERGTHEELIRRGGRYAGLHALQQAAR
jgi:ATP-binding cassette subfamily B protein